MSKNPNLLRAGGALSALALVGAAATWLKRRRSTPEGAGDSSAPPQLDDPAATDPIARLQAAEDKAPSAAGESSDRSDAAASGAAIRAAL